MKALLIQIQNIKDNSIIDNNVNDAIIRNALWKAQEKILQPLIGTVLYDKILDGVVADDLSNNYKDLIVDYIQDVLVQATLSYVIKDNTYKVTTYGTINVTGSDDYGVVDNIELNSLINTIERDTRKYKKILFNYLYYNPNNFPEFNMTSDYGYNSKLSSSTQDVYIPKKTTNNSKSFF